MKIFLTFITVLLFSHCTVCQILTIKDFNKLYNYSNPDDHSFLLNKGFLLSTDTVNIKKEDAFVKYYAYSFKKLNPREMLAVSYTKYKEGGYNFEVNYFVASVTPFPPSILM